MLRRFIETQTLLNELARGIFERQKLNNKSSIPFMIPSFNWHRLCFPFRHRAQLILVRLGFLQTQIVSIENRYVEARFMLQSHFIHRNEKKRAKDFFHHHFYLQRRERIFFHQFYFHENLCNFLNTFSEGFKALEIVFQFEINSWENSFQGTKKGKYSTSPK